MRRVIGWFGIGLWLLINLLAVGLLAAMGWNGLRQALAERQLNGPLSVSAGVIGRTMVSGDFAIEWRGNYLAVFHLNDPSRELFTSLPDRAFVGAATGRETVSEERGMFFFADQWLRTCPRQSLDQLTNDATSAALSGELICDDGRRVGYQLRFTDQGDGRLSFSLNVDDPAINRLFLTYASEADERFYGFGEQFSFVNQKGKRLPIWVSEQGIGRGEQPITLGADIQARAGGTWATSYMPVPHYLSNKLRALGLTSSAYAIFDMRSPDRVQLQLWHNQLDGELIFGRTPLEIVSISSLSSGRMRALPSWISRGAIVGMQGGSAKVREVLAQLQAAGTPISGVWLQDWVGQRVTTFGRQLWWNWTLDEARYPGWNDLVAELRADDIHVLTYINPFLVDVAEKGDGSRNLYAEALAAGYLVQTPGGEPYLIRNTSFSAALLDLSNPAARDWMAAVIRDEVLAVGASGWMADFGEGLPYDARLFSGEDPALAHNRYPELWAELNRAVVDAAPNSEELVFFMRAGYRQSPGSATLFWAGDQLVSWDGNDGIKTAVIAMVSGGFSGFSLNHSDIGGYTTITNPLRNYHRSEELLLRWMELSAFSPIYRSHEGNQPEQNVQVYSNERTIGHFARMAKVFAAWAPYREALIGEAAASGLPVVRHPFLHYPSDPTIQAIEYQQYMLGSELMVAPVLDPGQTSVSLYLPRGTWINLWDGSEYAGGQAYRVAAPLGEPAVFYPSGSAAGAAFRAELVAQGLAR